MPLDDRPMPPDIDPSKPTPARMYDYFLGGKDNFAADREAAERTIEVLPEARTIARENRAFLVRVVDYLAGEVGIDQFLDIGTGVPTSPNVHEIARRHIPDARVVYVDNDPVVTVHNRALRETPDGVVAIDGDLRRPEAIFDHEDFAAVIDTARPLAVLCVSVFPFVPSDEDEEITRMLREHLVSGSFLAITTSHAEAASDDAVGRVKHLYESGTTPLCVRTREQIEALFTGFELIEPGLTFLNGWRPTEDTLGSSGPRGTTMLLAGVGYRP